MTKDEALEVLRCPKTTDWAEVQRQYDDQYNTLQRLRETATTQEQRHEYDAEVQAMEAAYTWLKNLPWLGPVAPTDDTLPPELQQALRSPFADIRVDAVRTLGRLLHEEADLARLARQTLEALVRDASLQVAQAAREALQPPRQSVDDLDMSRQGHRRTLDQRRWRFLLLALLGVGLLGSLGLVVQHLLQQQREQRPPQVWSNPTGMQFVLIPAGSFTMGSTTGDDDEKPPHQVRISTAFYLGQYEVTQGQWQAVMGNNPSHFTGDPNLPVENVSWDDVQEFIRKLNAKEGGNRYRLPTEAEWEYAARAGSTTAYSFGDSPQQLGDYAWCDGNAAGKTHPVGQKRTNIWGLHDMHGNVWEWVQDWYGPYAATAVADPMGPSSGSSRVLRGGGWLNRAWNCRSADRYINPPGNSLTILGFRLLRTVP